MKTDPINIGNPADPSKPSLGASYIRTLAQAIIEWAGIDHYVGSATNNAYDEADAGKHNKVTYRTKQTVKPPLSTSDMGCDYIKGTTAEKYFEDAAGNEIQLTDAGKIRLRSTDYKLAHNTNLVGIDASGTGTVNLIKVNASNKPEIPDGAVLASSAAPTVNAGFANKKYVDDSLASGLALKDGILPLVFGGEETESVTLPNGLIMKMGYVAPNVTENNTVSFGTAFPTALISLSAVFVCSDHTTQSLQVSSNSVVGFVMHKGDTNSRGFYWMAIGR